MSLFSNTFADLVIDYLNINSESETRLLVPAPTAKIGRSLQARLRDVLPSAIPSFLIVDGVLDSVDEDKGWIHPEGIVTFRKGPIVIIVQPGSVSRIPESVLRAINSSFNDEWPWSLEGEVSAFSFKSALLPKLVDRGLWSRVQHERDGIVALISDYIVNAVSDSLERNELLFDDIIDGFSSSGTSDLDSDYLRFLFHAGIPNIDMRTNDEIGSLKTAQKACVTISQRLSKVSRSAILETLEEGRDIDFVDLIYDGLGTSIPDGTGLLSLRKSLKILDMSSWTALTLEKLHELLNIKQVKDYILEANFTIPSDEDFSELYISPKKDYLVAKEGADFSLDCNWNLGLHDQPNSELDESNFNLEIRSGSKVINTYSGSSFLESTGQYAFNLNISSDHFFGLRKTGKVKKISICITANGEVLVRQVLSLRMLCDQHSEVLVVEKPFTVLPYEPDNDRADSLSVELESPSNIHLLSIHDRSGSSLKLDEVIVSLKSGNDSSISQTTVDSIDPSAYPAGNVYVVAQFSNDHAIELELKSAGIKKGLFSIEDAFLAELVKDRSDISELFKIFGGESLEPYAALGGLTDESSNRVSLSKRMESPRGASPIIVSLEDRANLDLYELGTVVASRNLKLTADQFSVEIDSPAGKLIEAYQNARKCLIVFYDAHLGDENISSKHPLYARVPTYIHNKLSAIEPLIKEYVKVYKEILIALAEKKFLRAEEFKLAYLDCVVLVEDAANVRDLGTHKLFLIGPWHPLQVADRFQRQQVKFHAAKYCADFPRSGINKLGGTLLGMGGIRSIHGFSGHHNFVHSYVSDTSDLGWSIALKIMEESNDFTKYAVAVEDIFNLQISAIPDSSPTQTKSYIRDFVAANPAERRLEIYIRDGLDIGEIHSSVAELIYSEDSKLSDQLLGGVHLYFQNLEDGKLSSDLEWNEPPICIYSAPDEAKCLKDNHIDILIVAPNRGFKTQTLTQNSYRPIPRGTGTNAAMTLVLSQLIDGADGMSNSLYQETPYIPVETSNSVTDSYLESLRLIPDLINSIGFQTERSVDLPEGLAASWVILPGNATDPAMLSRYVNSSIRSDHQKVLWEYNVDLTANQSDYFILSEIAAGFDQALSASKFRTFDKRAIIADLSRVGIAVGGEALRTGMKALGVIGQVGAVRLFSTVTKNAPLRDSDNQAGLIIPVDSFDSILGSKSEIRVGSNRKSDLLAIQLSLNPDDRGELIISATSIEAKFASGKYTDAPSAFEQARQTYDRFKDLVEGSKHQSGVIQRLVLSKLIRYGLQLKYEVSDNDFSNRNYRIIDSILKGRLKWRKPEHGVIVCSTEGDLAESSYRAAAEGHGLWIRLSPHEWPGEHDEASNLVDLGAKLETIFNSGANSFWVAPAPAPETEPEPEPEPEPQAQPQPEPEPEHEPEPEAEAGQGPEEIVPEEIIKDNSASMHKMAVEHLESMYQNLIKSLKDRGVSTFTPEDGEPYITEGPASVLYRLNLSYDTDPHKVDNQKIKDLMHYRFRLEESQQLRIYKHRGSMNIDVPKQPEERYYITAQWLWARWQRPDSEIAVPLGINQRKEIIQINFSDANSPHLLIGGTTGTGKSVALYTILRGLLEHYNSDELKLILVDPKQTELIEFEESPYLTRPLGFNARDAEESLEKCVVEMEKRYRLFREASRSHAGLVNSIKSYNKVVPGPEKLPWWVIVLDEYADLTVNPDDKKSIELLLGRLAAKARASGIHIIIATQKPTVEVINTVLRSNLPAQLALTVKSGSESKVIMDDLGAEGLNGTGDAFLKLGGKLNRLQCAMVEETN